ncbi:MAG: DUF2232 domain-containing protein [Candidatus Hydrogenedentes bacterium]|nr:DUF2232 domain-containing protein [Candidatus Hydrogenedentota bacterium]
MPYPGLWTLLFAVTALFNLLPNPLSVLTVSCPALLYVVPVAVYTHFREWRRAAGLIAGAPLAALAGCGLLIAAMPGRGDANSVQLSTAQIAGMVAMTSANAVVVAALGLPIGVGTGRGWSYGRVVAAAAAAVTAVVGTYLALCWDAFNRIIDSMIALFVEQLNTNAANLDREIVDRQLESIRWFGQNKFAFVVGVEFAVYLALTCAFVSITAIVLRRRFADPGPVGAFRDMHPPDWLVWVGIVTALAWFVDREYGGFELRFVTWNVAVGLSSIYFLNGCAIFLYGLQVLAPSLFLIAMLVVVFLMSGLYPALSFIGLFDTWANFRMRMDRLAEAIRNAQSGES